MNREKEGGESGRMRESNVPEKLQKACAKKNLEGKQREGGIYYL